MPSRTRIKICCIRTREEARAAIDAGADALGLVSWMPSGPGIITEPEIADIAASVPPGVSTFLLTSLTDPEAIAAQHARCGTHVVQLCDYVAARAHARLRALLPHTRLVQVIHVLGRDDIDRALESAEGAHALLLDSGNPNLEVKELGGTGRRHNWDVSRAIRDAVRVPVFLAGGLTPENVAGAIAQVRPFGVDVCSGVRSNGALDLRKLAAFVEKGSVKDS